VRPGNWLLVEIGQKPHLKDVAAFVEVASARSSIAPENSVVRRSISCLLPLVLQLNRASSSGRHSTFIRNHPLVYKYRISSFHRPPTRLVEHQRSVSCSTRSWRCGPIAQPRRCQNTKHHVVRASSSHPSRKNPSRIQLCFP